MMMMWRFVMIGVLSLLSGGAYASVAADSARARCESLSRDDFSTIPDAGTQIVELRTISADGESPAYCRVIGYVAPQIGFELRLPLEGWNHKFLQLGCIGHCGSTGVIEQMCPLSRGYACIASDDGHRGTVLDALWADQNWQAKLDWGFRSPHVTSLAGKAIIRRFYGAPPARSYFLGRSTGGRQALQEAQRFPWDFDGIVALNPPPDLARAYMTFAWGNQATHDEHGQPLLSSADLKLLSNSAIAKCDLSDGVKDGIIGDPLNCSFDPSELTCQTKRVSECLAPRQVEAARKVYGGPTTPAGIRLTPGGPAVGSEFGDPAHDNGWRGSYLSKGSTTEILATAGLRYLFFQTDPGQNWTLRDFDFHRDYQRLGVAQALYDASNPDLRTFRNAGGKLLIFQGLNDVAALPRSTIDYYQAVERMMGGRLPTQEFARLFLLPGLDHVDIGPGADTIDHLGALEAWVERGQAPDRIIASRLSGDGNSGRGSVQFTRPLYPYPLRARYNGIGNTDDAANFSPVE